MIRHERPVYSLSYLIQRWFPQILIYFVYFQEGRAGYTPLHIAIEQKNVKLASYLLESCTNLHIDTQNYRRVTAYQLACELESSEMMEMLAKNGCAVISPPSSDYDDSNESDDDSDSDSDWFQPRD